MIEAVQKPWSAQQVLSFVHNKGNLIEDDEDTRGLINVKTFLIDLIFNSFKLASYENLLLGAQ